MKLPNADQAIVPERKITAYLLSLTHPDGRSKAAFFVRFGFTAAAWDVLAHSLQLHAVTGEVMSVQQTPYGTSYVVEGELQTPDRRDPLVRAVWFVRRGESIPQLVTAYKARGRRQ